MPKRLTPLEEIKKETKAYYLLHPYEKQEILQIKDEDLLFVRFIDAVKERKYRLVCLILNEYFGSSEDRALFGNKQDCDGNSAYHHAVISNCPEVVIILNDRSKYKGSQRLFLFSLHNNEGFLPFDLCCHTRNKEIFDIMWPRVGKVNHDPMSAYEFALQWKDRDVLEKFENHPKFKTFVTVRKKRSFIPSSDSEKQSERKSRRTGGFFTSKIGVDVMDIQEGALHKKQRP